jgi:hypothetical protein
VGGGVIVHLTDANGVVNFDYPTITGVDGGEAWRLRARGLLTGIAARDRSRSGPRRATMRQRFRRANETSIESTESTGESTFVAQSPIP